MIKSTLVSTRTVVSGAFLLLSVNMAHILAHNMEASPRPLQPLVILIVGLEWERIPKVGNNMEQTALISMACILKHENARGTTPPSSLNHPLRKLARYVHNKLLEETEENWDMICFVRRSTGLLGGSALSMWCVVRLKSRRNGIGVLALAEWGDELLQKPRRLLKSYEDT